MAVIRVPLLCTGVEQANARFFDRVSGGFPDPGAIHVWAVLTVIVGLSGPFNSYDLPVLHRFLFWSSTVALAILLGGVVRAFVHGALGLRDFRRGSSLVVRAR